MSEIKALASHYPPKRLTHAEEARWLLDYADDLAQFAKLDVMLACQHYRRDGSNKRMATSGELVALCRKTAKPLAVLPPPAKEEPQISAEERARVADLMRGLAARMRAKRNPMFDIGPAETSAQMADRLRRDAMEILASEEKSDLTPLMRERVDQARRLWPSHEVRA